MRPAFLVKRLATPQQTAAAYDLVLGKTTTGDDGNDRHLSFNQTSIFSDGVTELGCAVDVDHHGARRDRGSVMR